MKSSLILASIFIASNVFAIDYNKYVKTKVLEFHDNPKEFMQTIPDKFDHNGNLIVESDSDRSRSLERNSFDNKLEQRMKKFSYIYPRPGDREESKGYDNPFNLVTTGSLVTNLQDMDSRGLKSGETSLDVWSDDYWPTYKGKLGARFADRSFNSYSSFMGKYRYIKKYTAPYVFNRGDEDDIDVLSPSEKYDLLFSTTSTPLTNALWSEAKGIYDRYGNIETWQGICHGWAIAAYAMDRPSRSITVKAADNRTDITFYPSDIKALASLLWAHTGYRSKFVGGRCRTKNPTTDSKGRIISDVCRDTNPRTFHLSLVNEVGRGGKSFIMDAVYDYQVWNHPVLSYSYTYFNPKTGDTEYDLDDAKVDKWRFTNDKFRAHRSSRAKHIVGVAMKVKYLVETKPTQKHSDSSSYDSSKTVSYLYDLELDSAGNVIGGEWYQNAHPDFLWTVNPGFVPSSKGDIFLSSEGLWNGRSPLNGNWRSGAEKAGNSSQPLTKMVKSLIRLSNQ